MEVEANVEQTDHLWRAEEELTFSLRAGGSFELLEEMQVSVAAPALS